MVGQFLDRIWMRLEKDLVLVNSTFRYMTPGQRARVLTRVLNSVVGQLGKEIGENREGD